MTSYLIFQRSGPRRTHQSDFEIDQRNDQKKHNADKKVITGIPQKQNQFIAEIGRIEKIAHRQQQNRQRHECGCRQQNALQPGDIAPARQTPEFQGIQEPGKGQQGLSQQPPALIAFKILRVTQCEQVDNFNSQRHAKSSDQGNDRCCGFAPQQQTEKNQRNGNGSNDEKKMGHHSGR
jgi:hypothetical protein